MHFSIVTGIYPRKKYKPIFEQSRKELTKFEHPIVEFYNNYIPFEMNCKKKFGHYLNILFKPSYIKLKIVEIIFNFLSKFLFYNNYFFLICVTEKKIPVNLHVT